MSASLESLMRGTVIDSRPEPLSAGLLAFVAVGGSGVVAFVALSSLLMHLVPTGPEWALNALCYMALIVPVYLLHRRFSFRSETRHSVALPRYVAVQAGAVVLTALFSFVCYRMLGMESWFAAFMVIALTSGVNFVVLKLWAFGAAH
jgi:putative flippase GtrA